MSTKAPTECKVLMTEYLQRIRGAGTGSFAEIEPLFLEAMWEFDLLVQAGRSTQGDRQNTKGDFFNDVLEVLLQNASGKELYTRGRVPGLMFKRHNLDTAYPREGKVLFTIETKAVGTPKHPGNKQQKNEEGRPGAADLDKRMKEAAFKLIDIAAESDRLQADGGGIHGDLTQWLQETLPYAYIFFAARVVDAGDRKRCEDLAVTASAWFNGCGMFCYGARKDGGSGYEAWTVHPGVELARVFHRAAQQLRSLP